MMKRMTAIALFTSACIFSVSSALAQVRHREIQATVPFDFAVGSKQLPAGTYSIVRAIDDTIQIKNLKGYVVAIRLASSNGSPSAGCVLSFEKHAGQNFLHAVLCESAAISMDLPDSKLEQNARVEEAKLHETGGHVLIAAK